MNKTVLNSNPGSNVMDLCAYQTSNWLREIPSEIKTIKYFYCRHFSSLNNFRFLAPSESNNCKS